MSIEAREFLKKSIKTGVAVLQSIANRHDDFKTEIRLAVDEVANLAEKGNLYPAKKLVWEHVTSYGKVDAERMLERTNQLFESLNGQFPKQKAQAGKLRNEAMKDFEDDRFGDASRKARQAYGMLQRMIQHDNVEFANSIRSCVDDVPEWKRKLATLKG